MRVEEPPAVEVAIEEEPDPFADLPPDKQRIVDLVARLAPRMPWIRGSRSRSSPSNPNFEPRARSAKDARGLMQLIPDTATRFNVRNAFDPQENVKRRARLPALAAAYYRGQVALAVAAYNAGEGMVDKHRGIPPFAETREYVRKIRGLFRSDQHPFDPADRRPVAAHRRRSLAGRK